MVKSENAVLSVDGQPPTPLMDDDQVRVTVADVTAQFVRFGDPGYFYRNITMHMNENSLGSSR
jgi:NAD kinase